MQPVVEWELVQPGRGHAFSNCVPEGERTFECYDGWPHSIVLTTSLLIHLLPNCAWLMCSRD